MKVICLADCIYRKNGECSLDRVSVAMGGFCNGYECYNSPAQECSQKDCAYYVSGYCALARPEIDVDTGCCYDKR